MLTPLLLHDREPPVSVVPPALWELREPPVSPEALALPAHLDPR